MSTPHTPEPWQKQGWPKSQRGDRVIVTGGGGETVLDQADCEGMYIREINMDRAVACVNALAGLRPEGVRGLVEALEKHLKQFSWMDGPEGWKESCMDLQAALAAARTGGDGV